MKTHATPAGASKPTTSLPNGTSVPVGCGHSGGQLTLRRQRFGLSVTSRRVRSALLTAVVFAGSLYIAQAIPIPQDVQPATARSEAQSYTLDGIVINALTGKPISGAKAQLTGRSPVVAWSGPDGKFHFENLKSAQMGLQVEKQGFFWQKTPSQLFSGFIRVVSLAGKSPQVIVKLVPAAVISGRLVDPEGKPVANSILRLVHSYIWEGLKTARVRSSAVTNSESGFRFDWLTPGTYYVRAEPGDGWWGRDRPGSPNHPYWEGYPVNYYGGGRDLKTASPITVDFGQHVKIHFRLPKAQLFYQVSGRVAGLTPEAAFSVWFAGPDGQKDYCWCLPNPPGPKGHFAMNVPAGSYNVHADMQRLGDLKGVAIRRVDVTGDITNLLLTVRPLLAVPVDVQPTRWPVANIDLIRMSGPFVARGVPTSVGPPAGPYEILHPGPCTYRAQITVREPWYVASARSGDTNLLAENLTVSAEAPVQPIEIVLRHDVATIDGNVSFNGKPAPGVVLLIPQSRPRQAVSIPVGPNGEFRMDSLPPGEYNAYALDDVDELEYAIPEVMNKYKPGEKGVRVPPGADVSLDLELQKFKP